MNVVSFNERSCERYRRYFDAYLDNELLIETNQDVLQHLTSCTECTRILDDRARVKQAVRSAVEAEDAPSELVVAVRSQLGAHRGLFPSNSVRWMMAAAAVVLAIVGVESVQWRTLLNSGNNGAVLQAVSTRARDLLRVGLVDHVHCAILSGRWKQFISFDNMKEDTTRQALGPQFIELVPAVEAKLGSAYTLVQGHRCVANHRQYIHLILTRNTGTILSLVITEKNNESFNQADAVAVMKASGIPIYSDSQGPTQIAGFETDKYLAYVVSNLDRNANLNVASLMAPVVYNHLHRLEL